ncbi:hypothetical protein [Brumicola pallidula]|uniref:Uncharacterized protein n=1 Tax=Brumicola pallidula DSM 14239 = ACAM 615 TaxID=1121922 RepID=K6ZZ91_9ALTE|nr:hypothetical protein [Glaciecola pallidula]GAC28605.1 hypothetical protein GPAL_1742 [Glaciecola pallidula DSM 14239 = ACAM 615]
MEAFALVVVILIIIVIASKLMNSDLSRIVKLGSDLLELDESTTKRFLHSLNASRAQRLLNSFDPQKGADSQKFIKFLVFYLLGSLRLNEFITLVLKIKKKGYDYKLSHDDFTYIAGHFKASDLEKFPFEKAKEYEDMVLSDRFTLMLGGAKLRSAADSLKNNNDDFSENDIGISDLKNETSITGIYRRERRLTFSETWQRVEWIIATKFNGKFHLINLDIVPDTELSANFYEKFFTLPKSDYFVFLSEEIVLTDDEEASLPETCTIRIFDPDKNIVFKSKVVPRYVDVDVNLIFMLSNSDSEFTKLLKILKSNISLVFEITDDENVLIRFELDGKRNASAAICSISS